MEPETKVVKVDESDLVSEDPTSIELANALSEHRKVKSAIDVFILGLFIVFFMYSFI